MKKCLVLSIILAMVLSGCKDVMLNGNMKEYLEFYTTTAILSKHQVQTESYTDQAGNLTVPSHQNAVVNLYTTNPKDFTLIPQFTAVLTNGATLSQGLDSYGLTVEQDPSDLTRYTATLPQGLLEELDLKGSGITLTVTPMEAVSRRTMPEYTFTLRSNSKPTFGGTSAIVMQTKDTVDGSKKWVLCFELPDLNGIHRDIVALEINGTKYAVDTTAGQGAAALASMGSKLTTTDKIQVKDGGGVFFHPDVPGNGVYFITDDTIGTERTYTVRLVDSAGLAATLPPVSTADTTYGKEIVSFVFEASKNPQIASLGKGDLTGTISGTYISFNVPAALKDKNLTPTITLSGGTVNPASGTRQDFSQPATYTVTAGDGTTRSYTVSLNQFLPKPQLDTEPGSHTINTASMTIKPTNGLPHGTLLHYTVNGGQEQTVDPAQGIQLIAAVDTPYEIACWFQCEGYETSSHFTGTYKVELSPSAVTASVRSKDTTAQANETRADGSQTTTLTHNFDGLQGSAVTFSSTAEGVVLKVNGQDSAASYDIAPGETKSYTVTAHNQQGIQAARPVTFTITSSRKLPKPQLTPSVELVGDTYTLFYPETTLSMEMSNAGLPSGTILLYELNGEQKTLDLSRPASFTIPVGQGQKLSYFLCCDGYKNSEIISIPSFSVESRLLMPRLTSDVSASSNKYTVDYPTQSITMTLDTVDLPENTVLKYSYGDQTKMLSDAKTNKTITLQKGDYDDFAYWYECNGFTNSETASLGSFSVESKLPVLSLTSSVQPDTSNKYTVDYPTQALTMTLPDASNFPSGTQLKYMNNGQEITLPVANRTFSLRKNTYTDLTYWYECSGFTSSETASMGTFSVVSKLPVPVLQIDDNNGGVWQSSNNTYYTTTGSVTVTASAATIPSGTTLKYTVTGTSGTSSKTVNSGSLTTVTTLDIQGNAYSVTAWYECSGYENSTATTQNYTVWLHKSKIVLTATSLSAHNTYAETTTGSSPDALNDYRFYGATGANFTFSVASSVKNSSSLLINTSTSSQNNLSLNMNHGESVKPTSIYAIKNGSRVSDSVTFTTKATMRPITFTFEGKTQYSIGFQVLKWTDGKDFKPHIDNTVGPDNTLYRTQNGTTELFNGSPNIFYYKYNNWNLSNGDTQITKTQRVHNGNEYNDTNPVSYHCIKEAPTDKITFWVYVHDEDHQNVNGSNTSDSINTEVTAAQLYANRDAEWTYSIEDTTNTITGQWKIYFKIKVEQL